jgi:hypothetical protein
LPNLPVPVIIGLSMVTLGLAVGVWIAITMIRANRKSHQQND